jgi:hypothetical protein
MKQNISYNVTQDYLHLLPILCKVIGVAQSKIEIIEHACGEDVIFDGGKYVGYMDGEMFEVLDLYRFWMVGNFDCTFIEYVASCRLKNDYTHVCLW